MNLARAVPLVIDLEAELLAAYPALVRPLRPVAVVRHRRPFVAIARGRPTRSGPEARQRHVGRQAYLEAALV